MQSLPVAVGIFFPLYEVLYVLLIAIREITPSNPFISTQFIPGAQPSLDILKRIAVTFNVSADWLIFEEGEREPQDELKLKFEAVKQMDGEEQKSVTSILEAMILKHQAKRLLS